jgi:hypothetical protein
MASLALLALTSSQGGGFTQSAIQRQATFKKLKVLPSKWEDEQTSVASGQSLTLCGSLGLTLHAEDKTYNAFTYDKVNKKCVVARAVCYAEDFDSVDARDTYLMLKPDGTVPIAGEIL